MLHKVAHIAILMGLILMPIFAVYSAFFIKSFINVAMQIGIFLGYFCAVIWVYYFEFWYRQRKIAPAAPTGFTVS